MKPVQVFCGYDFRESAVYHVLTQSIINRSSVPVSVTPLHNSMLDFDGQQDGTNAFIYSRFLVPWLMDYKGWAIYCDSDMLFRTDPAELWNLRDDSKAVMVVKHDYETNCNRKFVGTPMEANNEHYEKKNWSSLILWNCGHPLNKMLTKEFVAVAGGRILHRFRWLEEEDVGELPKEWNHLVTEIPYNPDAKLVHWTLGAPGFEFYKDSDYTADWNGTLMDVNHMIGVDPMTMIGGARKYG